MFKRMVMLIVVVAAMALLAAGEPERSTVESPPKPLSPAQLAFERMKSLAGRWQGSDQDHRTERVQYELIADGTCVVETFDFVDQPAHKMVTVYHMDGEYLMLTHYCMAHNQPRMRATQINADASEVMFTFLDGTNLPSRDTGHMDKAVFKFVGADTYSSRWTWYQDGKESWMEESIYTRQK